MDFDRLQVLAEFLRTAPLAASADELTGRVVAASKPFGLWTVMAGALTVRGDRTDAHFYFGNWPGEWQSLYMQEIFASDPLVAEARRRVDPFTWSDLKAEPNLPDAARQAIDTTHEHGWSDGLAVPLHGPGGYVALVSFAGGPLALTPSDRGILLAIAHASHRFGRALFLTQKQSRNVEITQRELEAMRWVAAGKTDWEIGRILGISESTAHFHVEQAKRKLGVRSRSQAVGALLFDGRL